MVVGVGGRGGVGVARVREEVNYNTIELDRRQCRPAGASSALSSNRHLDENNEKLGRVWSRSANWRGSARELWVRRLA